MVWAVLGPTASGKSEAALHLAQHLGGEIVSCDSVQVYRGFDIGSAKPSLEEQALVPHHLIDILAPLCPCTTGLWRDRALCAVEDILGRGKVPIITGGAGLYFKSLYLGLFEGLSTDPSVRSRLERDGETLGLETLYRRLQEIDAPYAEKISAGDKLRIVRALEAYEVTGRPFSQLHQQNVKPNWQWKILMPYLPKEGLERRIEQRAGAMLSRGLIEETKRLIKDFPEAPALGSIGYREVRRYLKEGGDRESLKEDIVLHTRQFAKRQSSLFRSLLQGVHIHRPEEFL